MREGMCGRVCERGMWREFVVGSVWQGMFSKMCVARERVWQGVWQARSVWQGVCGRECVGGDVWECVAWKQYRGRKEEGEMIGDARMKG